MGKVLRRTIPALIISTVLSGGILAAFQYELLEGMERTLFDLRLKIRGELPHSGFVAIADIDENSILEEHLGRWPWPRVYQAYLVDSLNMYGASVIGYDVFFPEAKNDAPIEGMRNFFLDSFERMGLNDPKLSGKGKSDYINNINYFYNEILGAAFIDASEEEKAKDEVAKNLNPDMSFADVLQNTDNVILGYFFLSPQKFYKLNRNLGQVYKTVVKDFKDYGIELPVEVENDITRLQNLLKELEKDDKANKPVSVLLEKSTKVADEFEQSMNALFERDSGLPGALYLSLEKFYSYCWVTLNNDILYNLLKTIENPDEEVLEEIQLHVAGMESASIPTESQEGDINAFHKAAILRPNIKLFTESAKHFGHVTVEPDPDGVIRYVMTVFSYGKYLFPALSIKSAALYKGLPITVKLNPPGVPPELKIGEQPLPLDKNGMLLINYHGRKEYPRYSIYDIVRPFVVFPTMEAIDEYYQEKFETTARDRFIELYGHKPDEGGIMEMVYDEMDEQEVPIIFRIMEWDGEREFQKKYRVSPYEAFENKVVLVGATAIGIYDLRVTPFSENTPGVEIHAQVVDSIISDNFLSRPIEGRTYALVLIFGLAIFMGILIPLTSPLGGAAIVMTLTVAMGVFDYFYFFLGKGWWMPFSYPLIQMGVSFFAVTIYRFATEEREKRFIKDTFGRYLAPEVVAQLTENPEMVKLGGESVIMTAFFSDIQGFSTISEKLGDPQLLVELLNDYLTEMAQVIEGYEGTIDKYEGDAIIAFWGAPIHFEDHALKACYACLDQQEKLQELRDKWQLGGKWPEIVHNARVRMGLNTGEMVVGNMGSAGRMNYTIMGDAVNLAARLEGANKLYGTYTMISEYTYAEVKDHVDVRELDSLRVVGKTMAVRVYELLARRGQVEPQKRRVIEIYNEGLMAYKKQEWDIGIARFTEALNVDPNDGPSKTYLARCEEFRLEPPGDDWDGVFTMDSK